VSTLFALTSAGCFRADREALRNVSFRLNQGEFVALCGLNGAGKSTLLEIMSGLLRDYSGSCVFQDREVREWTPRALARHISFLPQASAGWASFRVSEVVLMGRYPFSLGWSETAEDRDICRNAMRLAGCEELGTRFINELSGGERQRVLFAAVLAQQPAALLLDEPGTYVDLPHQIRMFRTLRQLCDDGKSCIAATHDLNLAAAFATRIILLEDGSIAGDASPAVLLPSPEFRRVFGDHIHIHRSSSGRVRVHYEL
jgi:iron complex transport system ATP-binding protein